jgi:hypothetical protein
MIKYTLGSFFCKAIGHKLTPGGSCPFTGTYYGYCRRCNKMVPTEEVA